MKKLVAFFLALLILYPATAFADDATLGGTGETVYPVKDTQVVMKKEVIDIRVKNGRSFVTCQFDFNNKGKDTNLLVGFPSFKDSRKTPGKKGYYSKEDMKYLGNLKLYRFKTFVDGKKIPIRLKRGMKKTSYNKGEDYYPVWYTWNVGFKAGQSRKITNTYWGYNGYVGEDSEAVQYVLKTGAYWKDKIGNVLVRMHMKDINPLLINYTDFGADDVYKPDYITLDNTLVWKMKNLEPKKDIYVTFNHLSFDWYDMAFGYSDDENTKPKIKLDYEYKSYKSLLRMERHFDKSHYRAVIWWGNRIEKTYGKEQPAVFHYYLGKAYSKKQQYGKALAEFKKSGVIGLYDQALTLKQLGRTDAYKACLKKIAGEKKYQALSLWGKSRLKDLKKS